MSDKPTRHRKNRNAAKRVQERMSGNGARGDTSTSSTAGTQVSNADFGMIPLAEAQKVKRMRDEPKLPKHVAMETPNGQQFVHLPGLPPSSTPGVSAFDALFKSRRTEVPLPTLVDNLMLHVMSPGPALEINMDDDPLTVRVKIDGPTRHHRRRVAQHQTWRDFVIPDLLRPYLQHKYRGRTRTPATCYCPKRALNVHLLDWNEVTPTRLEICACRPAAEQLLAKGYFPCAPKRPSLAFNLGMLEFITLHSTNVAPNVTAWATTLQQYWVRRHVVGNYGDTFRKRLGTALKWYQDLDTRAELAVSQMLQAQSVLGQKRVHDTEDDETAVRKRARVDELHDAIGFERPGASSSPSAIPSEGSPVRTEANTTQLSPGSPPAAELAQGEASLHPAEDEPVERRVTRAATRAANEASRTEGASSDEPSRADANEGKDDGRTATQPAVPREKLTRPSLALRLKCPLCFGGPRPALTYSKAHVILCADGNFQQKRRKSRAQDESHTYPGTRFASEAEVTAMENEVEVKRARPEKTRRRGTARLDESVLNECEESFTAAQERVSKASKGYYSDTGLIALLCRHDRVIYLVNVTTPGERQYYVLSLLRKVMLELPDDWIVGLLYDIACQLSRSIDKHSFLEEFADRFVFGVSVFHAYGHNWACQLVFHPRKRDGFGLSDGEGCERFWSAIRRLIPGLRVSGFYRRLYVLDYQVATIQARGLWNLASWLFKRHNEAKTRRAAATARLDNGAIGAIGRATLAEQWDAQVTAQLKTLPRQSATAGDKALEDIMLALGRLDELRGEQRDARKKLKKVEKLTPAEASEAQTLLCDAEDEIRRTEVAIENMRAALGARASQRWDALRGDAYLRARINARRLRAVIRASIQSHKFEREKVERSFRRHVMQQKEHSQVKDLVHRREKNVAAQVRRFNALVDQMALLAKQGKAPQRKMVLPRRLDSRKLFKLDVDDDIWQEDPGLGPQDEASLPRWQTDQDVKDGIVLLLEERRCTEEVERIEAEIVALAVWWEEEQRSLHVYLEGGEDEEDDFFLAVKERADEHSRMLAAWRSDMGKSPLALKLPAGVQGRVDEVGPGAEDECADEAVDGEEPAKAQSDDDDADDMSSIYTEDGEEEDEPGAEQWDDLDGDAESDTELVPEPKHDTQANSASAPGVSADSTKNVTRVSPEGMDVVTSSGEVQASSSPVHPAHGPDAQSGDAGHESDAGESDASDKSHAREESDAGNHPAVGLALVPGRGRYEIRYRSGRFYCDSVDLRRLDSPVAWLSGDGLAVFAELMLKSSGVTSVDVVHPEVLLNVERLTRATARGDSSDAEVARSLVAKELELTLRPTGSVKWLVLAHVPSPQHWTLVEVRWATRTIHYYDSFSTTGGYAKGVEKRVRGLLKLCGEHFKIEPNAAEWVWVGEQRARRQSNGHDCGPFAAADLVSLLNTDRPSTKKEKEMVQWRREMASTVRAVEAREFIPKRIKATSAPKPKVSLPGDVLDLVTPPGSPV
ncbi:hypothetical protein EXIGLDRAFT_771164 [Exidia glandulosa HHB12029]|uniref:Ubiquitin-like protease family profile domain-containing protein n=1 Tax=Exidia glandulosa HHB12029 TaxID=1314781 RepID=A0A165G637_EXIGL|nr:hypothetical protein EXIGLDRAFT_771164 [Exidia glandulosa HHB12029]